MPSRYVTVWLMQLQTAVRRPKGDCVPPASLGLLSSGTFLWQVMESVGQDVMP
ncbi:MAG: hypothetical protein H7Z11_14000 [Verrucomicrobia bacterium]|nr:hypothetical protein [Leptolyngbya sp. ES-bin-22]